MQTISIGCQGHVSASSLSVNCYWILSKQKQQWAIFQLALFVSFCDVDDPFKPTELGLAVLLNVDNNSAKKHCCKQHQSNYLSNYDKIQNL